MSHPVARAVSLSSKGCQVPWDSPFLAFYQSGVLIVRRGKEWMGFHIQGMDGCGVLGHSQTDHRSVFSLRGQVLPADSLLNIVDVELIYGGIKYILKVKVSVRCLPHSGGSREFYFCDGPSLQWIFSCLVPGLPVQSRDLEI